MSNHAAGPWTLEDGDFEHPFYIRATSAPPGSRIVCALCAGDGMTQAANARLIAAAPDLLAAIEASLAAIEQGESEFVSLYLSAALKKLEGDEA